MNKYSIYIVIVVIIGYIVFGYANFYAHLTPEENTRIVFLNSILSSGEIFPQYQELDNDRYSTDLIKPRSAVISPSTDNVATSDFIGFFIYATPIFVLFSGNDGWILLCPLFVLLGVYSAYRLVKLLSNSNAAIVSALLLAVFPLYLFWSNRLMTDIPSISLILLGCSFYLGQVTSGVYASKKAILASLFLGLGISIRYPNVIFVLLFLFIFFPYKEVFSTKVIKFHLLAVITGVIVLLPILIVNNNLFGDPLLTGQSVYSGSSTSIRAVSINYFEHFSKFFVSFFGLITILFVVGLLKDIKSKNTIGVKFGFFTLSVLFVYVSIYGRSDVFGRLQPEALFYFSHVRYYLPVYTLLLIGSAILLYNLTRNKYVVNYNVALLAAFFITSFIYYKSAAFVTFKYDVKQSESLRTQILNSTHNEGYIFTKIYDRLIFPERKVVTYYNSGLDSREVNLDKAVSLAKKMIDDNKKVYFIKENLDPVLEKERNYIPFEEYERELNKLSLGLKLIDFPVYEVVAD